MEKLIELLNKFEKARIEKINSEWKLFVKLAFKPYTKEILTNKAYRDCWSEVCSKYYGFIKRLVENDKIERLAFAESWLLGKYTDFELSYDTPREDYTNMLLMELSIQDNSIEYLISVLR